MKVVLLKDVKDLGKKDTLVTVSDGYARNFLFPRGLAAEASAGKLNELSDKKASMDNKKALELAAARELADKIAKVEVKITTKIGENGKLFGSITNKEIAEQLKAQHKIDVDRKKITMDAIKSAGTFVVDIKIYTDVVGKLNVKVVGA